MKYVMYSKLKNKVFIRLTNTKKIKFGKVSTESLSILDSVFM